MRKKFLFLFVSMITIISLTACGQNTGNQGNNETPTEAPTEATKAIETPTEAPTESNSSNNALTKDDAQRIALEHAGVKVEDARRISVATDTENGVRIFEVEFHTSDNEFDYEIDVNTGEILGFSFYIHDLNNLPPSTNEDLIGLDEALNVAIERAGVSKDNIRQLSVEFDNYKKTATYEFEFRADRREFEVIVNATTGDIIRFERD